MARAGPTSKSFLTPFRPGMARCLPTEALLRPGSSRPPPWGPLSLYPLHSPLFLHHTHTHTHRKPNTRLPLDYFIHMVRQDTGPPASEPGMRPPWPCPSQSATSPPSEGLVLVISHTKQEGGRNGEMGEDVPSVLGL